MSQELAYEVEGTFPLKTDPDLTIDLLEDLVWSRFIETIESYGLFAGGGTNTNKDEFYISLAFETEDPSVKTFEDLKERVLTALNDFATQLGTTFQEKETK